MTDDNKKAHINIIVSTNLKEHIIKQAKRFKMTQAKYIRKKLSTNLTLAKNRRLFEKIKDIKLNNNYLHSISNNINQIAHKLNENKDENFDMKLFIEKMIKIEELYKENIYNTQIIKKYLEGIT